MFAWSFSTGPAGSAQVGGVAPHIGVTTDVEAGPAAPRVIVCYRVDDMAAARRWVIGAGGRAGPVLVRPYGLESLCADRQGTPFYLQQF